MELLYSSVVDISDLKLSCFYCFRISQFTFDWGEVDLKSGNGETRGDGVQPILESLKSFLERGNFHIGVMEKLLTQWSLFSFHYSRR